MDEPVCFSMAVLSVATPGERAIVKIVRDDESWNSR